MSIFIALSLSSIYLSVYRSIYSLSQFEWLEQGTIDWGGSRLTNNRNLFLLVLEGESLRSGCQHGQVLVKVLFWIENYRFVVLSTHKRELAISLVFSYKGTNSVHKSSTLMTY